MKFSSFAEFLDSEFGSVLRDDIDLCKSFEIYLVPIMNTKGMYLTDYWKYFCDFINSKSTKVDYDYCLLSNIGCGDFTRDSFCDKTCTIKGKGKKDIDDLSYIMYLFEKEIIKNKVKDKDFSNVKDVAIDFKDYRLKLKLSYTYKGKQEEILLSGDWIGKMEIIRNSQDPFELINQMHTLAGHVFWPTEKVNAPHSVNQARTIRKNIKKTLEVLKNLYTGKNDKEEPDLFMSFEDHKEYYYSFGPGEEGFKKYLDFWDMEAFFSESTKSETTTDLSQKRWELINDYKDAVIF